MAVETFGGRCNMQLEIKGWGVRVVAARWNVENASRMCISISPRLFD
jgi:hypothetical protein